MKKFRLQIGRSNDISLHRKRHTRMERNSLPAISTKPVGPTAKELEEVRSVKKEFDKTAVISLRRALRDRFSHRKDFRGLFSEWDLQTQGVITAGNLRDILTSIGTKSELKHVEMLIRCISNQSVLVYGDLPILLEKR